MTKCRLRVRSRKTQIFDVYFSVRHRPDFDWFRRFLTGRDTFLHFPCILHDLSVLKRYLDSKNIKPLIFLNAFTKCIPECIPPDTWIWMGKFRDHLHDFRRKTTSFRYRSMLREVQGDHVTFWRCRCQKVQKNLDITMYRFENNKEINKSLSENDDITIENTFWPTEVNFWPISTNEGSLRVSDTVLVHLQWSQTESDVKNSFPWCRMYYVSRPIVNIHFWASDTILITNGITVRSVMLLC